MVAIAHENLLGIGLYSPAEAAMYARVPTQLLNRWLFGSKTGDRVIVPQLNDPDEKLVTFLDFVQAMAIRAIRLQHKIPLTKIREAVDRAKKEHDVEYPFAMVHTTFLYGRDLVIQVGTETPVQLTGKHRGNLMIEKIVELYMQDLGWDAHGMANHFRAYKWGSVEIEMRPAIRFGEPMIATTGYSAQALWDAFKSEGTYQAAASAFGVSTKQVEAAVRYYDHLQTAA